MPLMTLAQLEENLARDRAWLNLPAKPWVPTTSISGDPVLDVAVVGAGMLGLVTLAALRNIGIEAIRAFDRAPAGREGPWITSARMQTLRTSKDAAGPALGLPSLTFRAWYEAQFGADAFAQMTRIPREIWMDYLLWYRKVLDLPVDNDSAVTGLALRDDGLLALTVEHSGRSRPVLARRVILATGIDGLGVPNLPAFARTVPPHFIAHSSDIFDVATLAGKRVAVIGAGASAMDNAAAALEAGAARVDIFIRRPDIPRIDKFTGIGSRGLTFGYVGLPDADKWRYMVEGERAQIPPPRHSVLRVSAHANAHFHLASPVIALAERDGAIEIETPKGRYPADFAIFATGFSADLSQRPEFADLAGKVRLWRDAYHPPAGLEHPGLGDMPYLGPGFEFLPAEGAPPAVSNIYCFSYPAVPSHGKITSGIPSIGEGATRLARAIARSLFVEDRSLHLDAFTRFSVPELLGDEWTDADEKAPAA
ncbi:oxidoreductase [Devosia yakushimensis]|uniref:Oxidoreductase n=2 Tax=Devosia yakushimensis TaxID=470028 RepID=A0ABQ5UIL8_9HYPH|nr:NAD(P)/FAD-dependent oxidoreductase [Devosia yakushimensis]GLQ11903.1 oxidoreductase [Devosia yakushimensis]